MCWRNHEKNHKILFENVDANDSEEIIEDENNNENDVENNREETRICFDDFDDVDSKNEILFWKSF